MVLDFVKVNDLPNQTLTHATILRKCWKMAMKKQNYCTKRIMTKPQDSMKINTYTERDVRVSFLLAKKVV